LQNALEALIEVQQMWFDAIGANDAQEVVRRAVSSAANLVCTTTVGFGGAQSFRDLDYDTLIVDEASKVTVGEFLIPAQRARRWILVGDEKQLTPYVEPAVEHHVHAMAAIHLAERAPAYTLGNAVEHLASLWHTLDDREQHPFRVDSVGRIARRLLSSGTWAAAHRKVYADQIGHLAGAADNPERTLLGSMREHLVSSLFERCVARTTEDTGPRRRLVEQRRMTPEIAELVRMPVYGGEYTSPPAGDPLLPRPLLTPSFRAPVVFLDTSSQSWPWDDLPEGTTSFINHLEADWVADVCRTWKQRARRPGRARAHHHQRACLLRRAGAAHPQAAGPSSVRPLPQSRVPRRRLDRPHPGPAERHRRHLVLPHVWPAEGSHAPAQPAGGAAAEVGAVAAEHQPAQRRLHKGAALTGARRPPPDPARP